MICGHSLKSSTCRVSPKSHANLSRHQSSINGHLLRFRYRRLSRLTVKKGFDVCCTDSATSEETQNHLCPSYLDQGLAGLFTATFEHNLSRLTINQTSIAPVSAGLLGSSLLSRLKDKNHASRKSTIINRDRPEYSRLGWESN